MHVSLGARGAAQESGWRLTVDLCAGGSAVCVLVYILECTSQKSRRVICGVVEAIIAKRVTWILRQTVKTLEGSEKPPLQVNLGAGGNPPPPPVISHKIRRKE